MAPRRDLVVEGPAPPPHERHASPELFEVEPWITRVAGDTERIQFQQLPLGQIGEEYMPAEVL